MPRILVTSPPLYSGKGPHREILEQAGLEIVYPPAEANLWQADTLAGLLAGIDGVLASTEPYTQEVFKRSKICAVARVGVGYDAVDVPAATEHGVAVTITPGTNEHSVAEHALAMILGVYRGFPGRDQDVRAGKWRRAGLPRLMGRTLGLVGMGRIGKAIVPRALGLGLRVVAYDPFPDTDFAQQHGVRLMSLDELLTTADIVSLHLPATPETANMIDAAALAKMKRGSVLINTARGSLVDEDALVAALREGHLMGAGLDVFKVEPVPTDHELLKFPNVMVAPHLAGLDHESLDAMVRLAAQCLADLYQGRWPAACVVNPTVQSKWSWGGRK